MSYDPNWPFPQRDEQGKPLVPADQPKRQDDLSDLEEALL